MATASFAAAAPPVEPAKFADVRQEVLDHPVRRRADHPGVQLGPVPVEQVLVVDAVAGLGRAAPHPLGAQDQQNVDVLAQGRDVFPAVDRTECATPAPASSPSAARPHRHGPGLDVFVAYLKSATTA
ncbi:hypothetical protein ABZV81_20390 [Streptomyces parvus]|uniref:hypothetical protein n=1 Tax=Streptomyces parvus TaxID=66428 RepID=UPI0033AD3C43